MRHYEFEFIVPPEAIDQLGHVNNLEYIRWVQDAATRHSEAVGLGWDEYRAMGTAFVVRRTAVEYLREVGVGEALRVATWIESTTRVTATRATEIRNAKGEVVVTAQTVWVYVTLATMRPTRMSPRIVDAFGGHPVGATTAPHALAEP